MQSRPKSEFQLCQPSGSSPTSLLPVSRERLAREFKAIELFLCCVCCHSCARQPAYRASGCAFSLYWTPHPPNTLKCHILGPYRPLPAQRHHISNKTLHLHARADQTADVRDKQNSTRGLAVHSRQPHRGSGGAPIRPRHRHKKRYLPREKRSSESERLLGGRPRFGACVCVPSVSSSANARLSLEVQPNTKP